MKRYLILAVLSMVFLFGARQARAMPDPARLPFPAASIERGYTLEYDHANFRVAVMPNLVNEEITLDAKMFDCSEKAMPADLTLVSDCYLYDILRKDQAATAPLQFNRPLTVAIRFDSNTFYRKKIYYWANEKLSWVALPSSADYQNRYIRAFIHLPFARLAVFEDTRELEGVASWYASRFAYGAATNNYPMHTKLRVKNVDNGKSVDVEVVSTGPFGHGRVIDLTKTAFQAIAKTWSGLARVQVVPLSSNAVVLGIDDTAAPTAAKPSIKSKAAIAVNVATGDVLYEKNSTQVLPIASLTKIVSAMVFLDTGTPWDKVVAYEAGDNAIGSRLAISPGETLTVKDLYYSGLVGSANNAINALARSTGLTKAEFVKRMNDKAQSMGLRNTHFTDPTGLDPTNVSTTAEYAALAIAGLKDLRVLQGTTAASYAFKTINTGQPHVITNRDKMIGSSWYITGTKTGYLDEALYCLMVKARASKSSSPDVLTVVLGSTTDAQRYSETRALITYSLQRI
ncbi:MAG: RlpA-like double-psi beta-barrel domain-containing protein [Patescibacteria group bacterium]